ncbi:MAG: redoxin domain-containing protein [Sphingobacteriales bacterium]|nr:redoxin domain-containing protein [Sphingobacteriales bacterium]MBI3717390.1 redoxin domain-containing protein [Sphingobacteriales bacterium]
MKPLFILAFLCPYLTIAQLTIGDKLPSITLSNITNYKTTSINLQSLKGKSVIIDCWGRYCAPCIITLGKLDTIQKEFSSQLQVITVSEITNKEELYKTLGKYRQTKNLSLPVVLGNKQVVKYFPYKLISHIIWINKEGVVKSITSSEQITKQNVQAFLKDEPLNWPLKQDELDFDYTKPLLGIVNPATLPLRRGIKGEVLFYSAFTSYIDGIAPPSGTYEDTATNTTLTSFYNYPLLTLAQIALDYSAGADRTQFELIVKDSSRYIPAKNTSEEQWNKSNTWCYTLRLPAGFTPQQIQQRVQQEIKQWLSTMGIEVSTHTVWVNEKPQSRYCINEFHVTTGE